MRLTSSPIHLFTVLSIFVTVSSGLDCYRYRINTCDNPYCNESNSILSSLDSKTVAAYVGMSVEELDTIPICEANNETEACRTPNYTMTCSKNSTSCGRSVFTLTTTVNRNIHLNQSVVDVVGGEKSSYESMISIHGCLTPDFKCQNAKGASKKFQKEIPLPSSNDASASGTTKIEEITVTNDHTACGHCETQLCNEINLITSEEVIHQPQNDQNSVSRLTASVLLFFGAGALNYF